MKLQERDQRNREEGFAAGLREGIEKGVREGINALILDNLEEGVSKERIIEKLMKRFDLERAEADEYVTHFTQF